MQVFENWHFTSKNTCLTFHSPVHTVCFCCRVVQHWPKKCTNSHPHSFTPSFLFRPFLRSRLFHLSFFFPFFFLWPFPILLPSPCSSLSFSYLIFLSLDLYPSLWAFYFYFFFETIFISFLFRINFPSSLFFFFLFIYSVASALLHHSHLISSWFVPLMLPVTIFPFFLLQSLALPRLPDIKLEIWWAVSTIKTWCLFSWAYFCFWLQPGLHTLNNN